MTIEPSSMFTDPVTMSSASTSSSTIYWTPDPSTVLKLYTELDKGSIAYSWTRWLAHS